jgi:hypothetical protein
MSGFAATQINGETLHSAAIYKHQYNLPQWFAWMNCYVELEGEWEITDADVDLINTRIR